MGRDDAARSNCCDLPISKQNDAVVKRRGVRAYVNCPANKRKRRGVHHRYCASGSDSGSGSGSGMSRILRPSDR